MNLNIFKTYVRVVETQNLSRTAEEFGLSQPAITKQIQALEDIFGVLLLERSGRKLKTTEAGDVLFHYAKEIIKLVDKTEKAMEEAAESRSGNLYIGASTIPGQYIIPSIMKTFKEKHPNIAIKIDIADTEKIFNKVADRELDIGIVGGWIKNRKVEGFPWKKDELVLIVPSNHRLAQEKIVEIRQLLNEKWIFREKGSGTGKAFEEQLAAASVKKEDLQASLEAGSTEAVIASVEAGIGIAVVSKWAANKAQGKRDIVSIRLQNNALYSRYFYIIYPRQKTRRKSVLAFLDYINPLTEEA